MPASRLVTGIQLSAGSTENSDQLEQAEFARPMSSPHYASYIQNNIGWPEQQFYTSAEDENVDRSIMHAETFRPNLLPSHPVAPSYFPDYNASEVHRGGSDNWSHWLPGNNPLLMDVLSVDDAVSTAQCTRTTGPATGPSYSGQIVDAWANNGLDSTSQVYLGSVPGRGEVRTSTHSPTEALEHTSPRPADGEEVPQHIPEPGNGHRRMPAPMPFVTFTCRGQVGIRLSTALPGPPQDSELDHAEDDTLLRDFKSKVYYFIFWPGYKPFMQSKNNHRKRNFVTRAEIVHHVARAVYSFFSSNERYAIEEGHEKWRVGGNGIKLENIKLIGLKKYGAAGITPVLAYHSVPVPRAWEY